MPLTEEEHRLVLSIFDKGPAVLFEVMEVKEAQAFLHRQDVWAYLELLTAETAEHPALMERTKFIAFRHLRYLSPVAMQVVESALKGMQYERDKNGSIVMRNKSPVIKSLPPDDRQIDIAMDILNRLGVNKGSEYDPTRDATILNLLRQAKEPIQIPYKIGLEEQDKTLRREGMRLAIERLNQRLPEIKKKHGLIGKKTKKSRRKDKEPILPSLKKKTKSIHVKVRRKQPEGA